MADSGDPIGSVLFLCTGNSCRSQMAEGLLRQLAGNRLRVFSAGSRPRVDVDPVAIEAMAEIGIDVRGQTPKSPEQIPFRSVGYVITLCSQAAQDCPNVHGVISTLHWHLDDPVAADGDAARLAMARRVRDELRKLIDEFWRGIQAMKPKIVVVKKSRGRRWAFRVVALCFAAVIAASVMEVGLRVFAPQPTGFYAFDDFSNADGSLRPGASGVLCGAPVTINGYGERGAEHARHKSPGDYRICVIGDSIVFGLGVNDDARYTRLLETALSADRPVEVVPFAQVAYGLEAYRTRLLPKALGYSPDMLLIGFVLNDFEPTPVGGTAKPSATALDQSGQGGIVRTLKAWTGKLRKRSHLVYLLRKQMQVLLSTKLMSRAELVKYWEVQCMYADSPEFRDCWAHTVKQLDEIQAACKGRGIPLVIATSPFDIQMNSARLARYREYLPDLPESALQCIPQQMLAEYCGSRGIPFVDTTDAFKRSEKPVFFQVLEGRTDLCHPNPEGHRIMAEVIAARLRPLIKSSGKADLPR